MSYTVSTSQIILFPYALRCNLVFIYADCICSPLFKMLLLALVSLLCNVWQSGHSHIRILIKFMRNTHIHIKLAQEYFVPSSITCINSMKVSYIPIANARKFTTYWITYVDNRMPYMMKHILDFPVLSSKSKINNT